MKFVYQNIYAFVIYILLPNFRVSSSLHQLQIAPVTLYVFPLFFIFLLIYFFNSIELLTTAAGEAGAAGVAAAVAVKIHFL